MTATVAAPATTQVYQLFIKASPEQIWDAITKSEFRRKYFHGSSVESTFEPGSPIRSFSPSGETWGDNTVLESDPPRKLVHGWRSLYDPELAAEPESRVTWEIEPQEGGYCKFTLTHDQLEESPKTAANVRGWLRILCGMKTVIETGEPMSTAG
jgi:uncharacterized protein YndB with AHSA1/START domain